MKAFPFNNWLQESWKRDGRAPHLFVELMDGTIEHSAIKFNDIFGIGGLQFYSDLESKTIKRAIIIYPHGTYGGKYILQNDGALINTTTIAVSILDGKSFYFTANIDDLKLINIERSNEPLSMPEAWNEFARFLMKRTTAKVQYAGNIPPTV